MPCKLKTDSELTSCSLGHHFYMSVKFNWQSNERTRYFTNLFLKKLHLLTGVDKPPRWKSTSTEFSLLYIYMLMTV